MKVVPIQYQIIFDDHEYFFLTLEGELWEIINDMGQRLSHESIWEDDTLSFYKFDEAIDKLIEWRNGNE